MDDLSEAYSSGAVQRRSLGAMETDQADVAHIERQLDELQRESDARRSELRSLAEQLPQATSRRAVIRSMFSSVVHAPDRPLVIKRVVLKIARTPADLVRRVRNR